MVEWALLAAATVVLLIGSAAGFGYSAAAARLAATNQPGSRTYGLRVLVAILAAVAAAELLRWSAGRLDADATVYAFIPAFPILSAVLGYPVGYVGGLLHRAGRALRGNSDGR